MLQNSIFTKKNMKIISSSPIFKNIDNIEVKIQNINHRIKEYKKGFLIAQTGDLCNDLIIIIEGEIKTEMIDNSGKLLKIEDLKAPQTLAIAFIFGQNNTFPVNITASTNVKLLYIPKESLITLFMKEEQLLKNFLNIISNRAQFLSNKVRMVSFKSLKGKIANYILSKAGDYLNSIELNNTQQELADIFGVARPSLARTLSEMEESGLIKYEKKTITILNREELTNLIR